ncbi:MAG: bifunctional hydroxymethylpyrimidine kinase/phosphomethylpyrimidine kinase [Betaproteobacteria bacterium]|nr:bifunctional hydroxymethylpyrimidine kinase/phosphomethylpyrimidine kinase [Betaproteobacteria bacterium]
MTPDSAPTDLSPEAPDDAAGTEPAPPACVMCFNASDASGAAGLPGDIATVAAMGAHALPVVTAIVMRDTADVFDQHAVDADAVAEQARTVLEDVTVAAWKVGFLGSAEGVSAVAEILSDYADIPVVAYLPGLTWLDEDKLQPYLDAFRELILPAAEVLVGSHKALQDFLLPDWDSERAPSARELAVAAGEHGTRHVLVTGILLPTKGKEQYIDNVLATPQGAIAGEKFEMFDAAFVGAGDTLSAALAALLASGAEMTAAVSEALSFLDQSLDAGFRPGMGNIVPDRFFWALPPEDEEGGDGPGDGAASGGPTGGRGPGGKPPPGDADEPKPKGATRRVH